ncbi:MAG: hypothetical protein KA251_00390 [Saprospiraceae bacterium]|nr:hypothetical protein [Candidatus Vicinibacter affinis]MBP6521409.1 hypothetical protein [Saprospiraceae bacterium]MBK6821467.1 hypothetical protein [Candidatus Vicinibacter affinis]MBK7695847.1 hypothetical protein [Candidatus Vicinibacter affinis]MBK7798449.1 hypothetical protein [Candidatus Vicinibacter affinis]
MLLKRTLFFIWLFAFPVLSNTQIIYYDQQPFEDLTEVKLIYKKSRILQDSMSMLGLSTQFIDVLESGPNRYLVVDGFLYLFEWQKESWNNISKSKYHGNNFRAKKFFWNGELFCFGGYGFWREHGDLIKFDWTKGEWETAVVHYNKDIGNNVSFLTGDVLNVINPISRNQHINSTETRPGLYSINLNTLDVQNRCTDPDLINLKFAIRIETKNYFLASFNPVQIIDKLSSRYKFSDLTFFNELYNSDSHTLYLVHGDSIVLYHSGIDSLPVVYDLDKIYRELPGEEKNLFKVDNSFRNLVLLLLLIIFSGIIVYYKRKSKREKILFEHPFITQLLRFSGQKLSQDELDQILEIDTIISVDTMKSRRAALFNEINKEYSSKKGLELITRVPDPLDKRKFLYYIS